MTESRRPDYKQIRFDRLEALSAHVRNGKLGHKVFDFAILNDSDTGCGTNGCAMGELPILFPKDWEFSGGLARLRVGADTVGLVNEVADFFGLWRDEVAALFIPFPVSQRFVADPAAPLEPHWTAFHCQKLGPDATRAMVADNLDAFIAYHKANP